MSNIQPVAPKLGKLLRLLSSDRGGEVLAAVSAITRTLKAEGLDLHSLAEAIEASAGEKKFSEADALEIYQRGVAEGRAAAAVERGFRNVGEDDQPTWREIACECEMHLGKLREREREFVQDMVRRTVHGGGLTEKQQKWLRDIYARVRR
jgi:hypothetical protein